MSQPTTTYLETISTDTDTSPSLINTGDVQPRTVHAHYDGPASSTTKQQIVDDAPVTPRQDTLKKADEDDNRSKNGKADHGVDEKTGMGLYGKGGLLQFGLGP